MVNEGQEAAGAIQHPKKLGVRYQFIFNLACAKMPCKRHACSWEGCHRLFSSRQNLVDHIRSHTGEKPFVCKHEGCKRQFARSFTLEMHTRTHTGERPYKCTQPGCGKAFSQHGNFLAHCRRHRDEKPNVCHCGMSFVTSGALQIHQRVHSGSKPYACTWAGCSKSFSQLGNLQAHVRGHTGQRPFSCPEPGCDKAFHDGSALNNHQRTHDGARPYQCNVQGCGMAFAVKRTLESHLRTHTGERPYKCDECGAAFTQCTPLTAHKKAFHSEEGQQRQKQQEQRVAKMLEAAAISFKREHHVDFGCWEGTFARCDFLLDLGGGVIILEVDEDQHDGYGVSCDVRRMADLHQAFLMEGNTLPVAFLRYNPHAFKVDGVTKRTTKKEREARLLDVIRNWQHTPPGSLSIQYMYYNSETVDGKLQPVIWEDPEYDSTMKSCCMAVIV